MKEGYKNREVASRRNDYSMYMLSQFSQRQIATTGMLDQEQVEFKTEGCEGEKFLYKADIRRIESVLKVEYYSSSIPSDGGRIWHFIDMELGLVSVIFFGDTFLAHCKDEGLTKILLKRLLCDGINVELAAEYIRVFLAKPITPRETYNRLQQMDTGST